MNLDLEEDFKLESRPWWNYAEEDLRELFTASIVLAYQSNGFRDKFHDFAFVVFPAAKAYEGFLKKVFFDKGFITQDDYSGKHFRVGKALNPSLEEKFRSESVYDKVSQFTGSRELADKLWDTWRRSRNLLFHWFPNEKNSITLDEARINLHLIFDTVDDLYKECMMDKKEV